MFTNENQGIYSILIFAGLGPMAEHSKNRVNFELNVEE